MTLRVKLEIVPWGQEEKMYEIGRLDIFNKGRMAEDSDLCQYGVIDLTPGQEGLFSDTIYHYRKDGAWFLVQAAISDLGIN